MHIPFEIPDFELREAERGDVPAILALIRELAEYEKLAHEVVATEEQIEQALFGERPSIEVLLGVLEGAPVGFAMFFHNFSSFLGRSGIYLEDLYVKPEARGRGIGKYMLRALARTAKERGCRRLEWSVLDWNEPAIKFYESLGARPMSEWTVHRVSGKALDRLAGPS